MKPIASFTPAFDISAPTPGAGALSRPGVAPDAAAVAPTATAVASGTPQAPASPQQLQHELDRVLARAQTSLRFRVDDEAGRIVVSVVDRVSGELLLQIPDETALAIARRLADTGQGLIDHSA